MLTALLLGARLIQGAPDELPPPPPPTVEFVEPLQATLQIDVSQEWLVPEGEGIPVADFEAQLRAAFPNMAVEVTVEK